MWLGIEIKEDVARKRKLKRMWLGIEIKGCGSEEEIKEDVARKRKLKRMWLGRGNYCYSFVMQKPPCCNEQYRIVFTLS